MTGHCDADVLAEYRDGLLGRRRSARIRAHLAGCARCSALAADLAEVSALLASVPPPPMPDELITRLDGVLAAESAARAQAQGTVAAAGGSEGTGTVTPAGDGIAGRHGPARTPRIGGRRRPYRAAGSAGRAGTARPSGPAGPGRTRRIPAQRAASVAAAVLVLAGGGYGVSRLVQGGSGQSSSGSAGAAAGPAHRPMQRLLPQNSAGGGGSAITAPAATLPVVHSGTDYLPGRLTVQAQAVLARYPAGRAAPAPAAGDTSGPQGCASLVAGGARLRLIDVARYRGQPAIVIMTAAAAGRPGQIWVAGAGCPAAGRDVIAHAQLTGAG